jgi:hypothetical protein
MGAGGDRVGSFLRASVSPSGTVLTGSPARLNGSGRFGFEWRDVPLECEKPLRLVVRRGGVRVGALDGGPLVDLVAVHDPVPPDRLAWGVVAELEHVTGGELERDAPAASGRGMGLPQGAGPAATDVRVGPHRGHPHLPVGASGDGEVDDGAFGGAETVTAEP